VIKSFKHKGLKKFFNSDSVVGINPQHKERIRLLLSVLDVAKGVTDFAPDLNLHRWKVADTWSIKVSGNWRIIFRFDGQDVIDVDLWSH